MAKHEPELVELTNLCMIIDKINNKVLVQVRSKDDWRGISFPGGHVEPGESIVESVIREVKEETNLDISNLSSCGMKDWYDYKTKKRYLVLFFKTSTFSGELLTHSNEGENKWMSIEEIYASITALDFKEMLDVMLEEKGYCEFFYEDTKNPDEEKRWVKRLY